MRWTERDWRDGRTAMYATDAAQMVELLEAERAAGRWWTIRPIEDGYRACNESVLDGWPRAAATPQRALAEALLAWHRAQPPAPEAT